MRTSLLSILIIAAALSVQAETRIIRQSAECKIARAKFSDDAGVVKVPLKNDQLEILCKFRADDFFGRDVVMANPQLKNLSGKELDVAYHVAFFSKSGELIGSATQQGSLKTDANNMQFGSCIITAPTSEIAKIASYKVTVYIDDAKPKK